MFKNESSLAVVRRIAVVLRVKARSSAANSNNAKIEVVLVKARISAAKSITGTYNTTIVQYTTAVPCMHA